MARDPFHKTKQDSTYEPIEPDYDGINGQYPYEQHQAPNLRYNDPLNQIEPKIGQKGPLDELIERCRARRSEKEDLS